MIKKMFLLLLGFSVFFSAGLVFAAAPTVSALSAAYKSYLTPPSAPQPAPLKIVKISDLVAAYKNYVSIATPPATPAL